MILISHRGNVSGPDLQKENHPDYITTAKNMGFDVEVDVWFIDKSFYLGHDVPTHEVEPWFLRDGKFWCHAKNIEALHEMMKYKDIHCFWHQSDDVTLTSKGYIWTYPGKGLTSKSIAVMPESHIEKWWRYKFEGSAGVCSDYVRKYRDMSLVW